MRSGIQVQLSVRHGRAAVEFYAAAFGATKLYRWGGDDANEEVVAQLAVGDGIFWVEDESPDHHNFSPQSLGGATERVLLIVDHPPRRGGAGQGRRSNRVAAAEDARQRQKAAPNLLQL